MKNSRYFSVGICAFNEAKNIANLIEAIQNQKLPTQYKLREIIVVASGCTDDTIPIVKKYRKKDKKIKLITQRKRRGKAIAVNLFLDHARSKLLILQSADTIPSDTCFSYLLKELIKSNIGLVAGRVIPKDNPNTICGFANSFKWTLHHKINLQYPDRPKVGEMIAFKKVFERIPPETVVDEASVEPLIHLQGFKIKYVPKAIIFNQGPKTIREYLSGRRRIYAGHFVTKKKYAYEIITLSGLRVLTVYINNLKPSINFISKALLVAILEIIARTVGYLDVKLKLRDHTVWKIAKTSKKLNI